MSKVSFTKLGLKRQDNIKVAKFGENEIEVKQYLPINEKLELVEFVLNNSADQNNFANPLKVEVFTNLAILYYYTNICVIRLKYSIIYFSVKQYHIFYHTPNINFLNILACHLLP